MTIPRTFDQRYIPEPNTGCWLWLGVINRKGYGVIQLKVKSKPKRPSVLAHRYSYAMNKGAIPDGLFVCHSCDQRSCINPDHLFLGTAKDNQQDMARKGRGGNPTAKMTMEKARQLRGVREETGLPWSEIGPMFGITRGAASAIGRGLTWRER
jgi:hypothetical protein